MLTDERGGGHALRDWATLTWGDLAWDDSGACRVRHPSGWEAELGERQVEALDVLARWARRPLAGRPLPRTDAVVMVLPGRAEFMGVGWVDAIIATGTVTFEGYARARGAYEAELRDGVSTRRAWERAKGRLAGIEPPEPGPRGPKTKLGRVPVELQKAFLNLAQRAELSPATARVYKAVLLRVFERSDGRVPEAATLDRVLDRVAERFSYAAGARSAWRALVRSAQYDRIELPLPEVRTGGGRRRRHDGGRTPSHPSRPPDGGVELRSRTGRLG